MNRPDIVLVNSNRMRPPVAPIALDYIGDALAADDYAVQVIDLAMSDNPETELHQALSGADPIAVGITFRNTDDCFLPSGQSFVPQFQDLVGQVRDASDAPILLGGCGFSLYPTELLNQCQADYGIIGDAEETVVRLLGHLENDTDPRRLKGLVYHNDQGQAVANPPVYDVNLNLEPDRSFIDNARYFRQGGMGNIETKRGCPASCIYCADPVARGRAVRCRPAREVVNEIENLLSDGVNVLHFCDGEFNMPPQHALAVCHEIIARGLSDQLRWYCYAAVAPFDNQLAAAMQQAGCVGINFGADSACDRMLHTLKRGYQRDAITDAVQHCRDAGITVMLDLMIGGPGEDEASVRESIEFCKQLNVDRIGAATGIRLYPGTPLAREVRRAGPLADNRNLRGCLDNNDSLLQPVFYLSEKLGEEPADLVCDLIGDDERFFPPPRTRDRTNYNYNDNQILENAIAEGYRGAFWDILRQLPQPS